MNWFFFPLLVVAMAGGACVGRKLTIRWYEQQVRGLFTAHIAETAAEKEKA